MASHREMPQVDPYARLALGILQRAVMDARSQDEEIRQDARTWLEGIEAEGLADMAGIHPMAWRARLRREQAAWDHRVVSEECHAAAAVAV